MDKNTKKAVPFTYNVDAIKLGIKKHYGRFYNLKTVRIIGKYEDGDGIRVKFGGNEHVLFKKDIAVVFGGIGGYYKGNDYVEPRVELEFNGSEVVSIRVWKDILTWDEFNTAMRVHNRGFADKGNPDVWTGVVVYSPSASGWQRTLWDCEFEDRAYSCHSNGEIFLEEDPSSGLCRHAHCIMTSLRGDRAHGGEVLLRPNYNWTVDYCYIVEE